MASTLSDDTAPSASLDHLEAQAAPTHPRAQPEPLGSLPWPQELASGRPKVEDLPLSTTRWGDPRVKLWWRHEDRYDCDESVLALHPVPAEAELQAA